MKNGDRSYKLEVKPGENIGSYHVIESQKVNIRYPGQQPTCGHCHESSRKCRGGGLAKKCRAAGGIKVEFTDYILGLWKKINYFPQSVELANDINEDVDSKHEHQADAFTPVKPARISEEEFAGVKIKQFPKDYDPPLK